MVDSILIEQLQGAIVVLTTENKYLKSKVQQLEERLGLNSKNSSIPTSKELYKIKDKNKKKSENK